MKTQGYTAFVDRTMGYNNGLNICSKESSEHPLMLVSKALCQSPSAYRNGE